MGDWMSEQKRNEVGLINMPRRDEKAENLQKHMEWPFYKDAENYRESIRKDQIVKGSEKYPEPFTTKSWSNQEIVDHAMQENVDQGHYIFATGERMRELAKQADEQHKEIKKLDEIRIHQGKVLGEMSAASFAKTKKIKDLEAENEKIKHAITDNCNLRKHIGRLQDYTKAQNKALTDLKEKNENLIISTNAAVDALQKQKIETEYWRLRTLQNNNWSVPTGVPVNMQKHMDNAQKLQIKSLEELKKEITKGLKNNFHTGGCV